MTNRFAAVFFTLALLLAGTGLQLPADELSSQEQLAFQQAVAAADPSVVRIETVGGMDLVGEVLTGTGPTTGVVVRADGYIITSRFNFLSRPASVIVTLPDERRFAAEIVASDLARMLTLLKIEADDLVPLPAVPREEIQVGQWAISLGRTFDLKFPNISVGIISALNRVWGKAIQTDAKTSPVNYGGPLIDLSGRCLGVIVPLSPQGQGETAGVEWYDSGIGFAVPMADIQGILPRLIAGETLKPGLMGVSFEDAGPLSGEAKIIRVRPESPADQAGLLTDDVITTFNGRPIEKLNTLKHVLGTLYARDTVTVTIRRGDQTLEKSLTLTDVLKAYQFPYLGILPDRAVQSDAPAGVRIRAVLQGSPAAAAKLAPGDVIREVAGQEVGSRQELARQIDRVEPHAEVPLTINRQGQNVSVSVKLGIFPNDPPQSLNSVVVRPPETPVEVKVGRLNEQLPGDGLGFWGYVPENYRSDQQWGLLVWLHPAGETMEAQTLRAFSEICRDRGYLLAAPRAEDVGGWSPELEEPVHAVVGWFRDRYRIDPARIVTMGFENSGPFATRLAFKYRDTVRGLVLLSAPLRVRPPDNDPDFPLQIALVSGKAALGHRLVGPSVELLRKQNFPTWLLEHDVQGESVFDQETVAALALWLDALDRL